MRLFSLAVFLMWILGGPAVSESLFHTTGFAGSANRSEKLKPIFLQGYLPGQGVLRLIFRDVKYKDWSASITADGKTITDTVEPILLSGTIKLRHGRSQPVSAAVIPTTKQENHIVVSLRGIRRAGSNLRRLISLRGIISLNDSTIRFSVASAPETALGVASCKEASSSFGSPLTELRNLAAAVRNATATSTGTIEISTEADHQYSKKHGSNTNADIAANLHAVAVVYVRDLRLTLKIIKQNIFEGSSPYSSTDPSKLLREFHNYLKSKNHLGRADVYQLFTAKNLTKDVKGIAYVGVVCSNPEYSLSLIEDAGNALNPALSAHELGHNLGAEHDTSNSIMNPVVSVSTFSDFSKRQISEYVTRKGGCLHTLQTPSSPLAGFTVSLSRKRLTKSKHRLTGTYRNASGDLLVKKEIKLYRNGKVVKSARTDGSGKVSFVVTARARYSLAAHASGFKVKSRELRL